MEFSHNDPSGRAALASQDAAWARVMTLIATGQPLPAVLEAIAEDASKAVGWACCILPSEAMRCLGFDPVGAVAPKLSERAIDGCFKALAHWVGQDARGPPQRLVCADLHADPRCIDLRPAAAQAGLHAVWLEMIMGSDGALLGVVASLHAQPREPSPEAMAVIEDVVHVAAIAIDRERSVQALRDSQALLATKSATLEATLERMEQGVMMVSAERVVEVCNRRAMELLDLPAALIASRPSFAQVLEYQWSINEFELTPELIRDFVREGGILDRPQSYERTRPNGRVIEMRSIPIEGGGVLRTYTDVTERRQAETERLALENQLQEARKMEAIGTLAGGIAHDFNNILAAILGNVALAKQELAQGHPAQAFLEQIAKAGRRARSLVQQILAFSRHQPSEPVSVPLNPLVEETAAMLEPTLGPGVQLHVRLPAMRLAVMGEATQLQQVLMNLGTNAVQALGAGHGRIEIGLEAIELDEHAPLMGGRQPREPLPPGSYAVLWVSDDGVGIDDDTRHRIFEPFFTTKAPGSGTGLGLAVVHGIVKAMNGSIQISSVQGQGSTFSVYLPLVNHESRLMGLDPLEDEPPAGNGQHVLYVDDDDVMAQLVQLLLQRLGYRCTACSGAAEALTLLQNHEDGFDLIVTDYNMPGTTGLDLARTVAGGNRALPVVITSGYVSDSLCAEASVLGVSAVMQKERTLEELGAVVHRALAGRQKR